MTATHITAPDGSLWQLVPVELTAEMQTAAAACWDYWQNGHVINAMWPDMLAAAPEFGGVAVACHRLVVRHGAKTDWCSGEPSEYTREYAAIDGYRIELAYTHPPAADEAMGRDTLIAAAAKVTGIALRGENGNLDVAIDELEAAMRGGESGE